MAILYSKKVSGFKISSQKMLRKIWELKEESCFKYYEVSRRDKSLMRLLFMMSLVFFLTNIPMAVGRIIQSLGITTKDRFFKEFAIVANVMEMVFAASNFYLYCFCNNQFRRNVRRENNANNEIFLAGFTVHNVQEIEGIKAEDVHRLHLRKIVRIL